MGRLGDGGRRMLEEILLQGGGVGFEFAAGSDIAASLHTVESISSVGGEETLDTGQPDPGQLGDGLLDEVGVRCEPEDFHTLLDLRTGVVVTVVGYAGNVVGCESERGHGFLPIRGMCG